MNIQAACKCGTLKALIGRAHSSFTYYEETAQVVLKLSQSVEIKVFFCPICGGQDLACSSSVSECTCYSLSKWANQPGLSIHYDPKFCEYYLSTEDNTEVYFYYCLICGGQLPVSKRKDYFTTPSRIEISAIMESLRLASSISEVENILGRPDYIYDAVAPDQQVEILHVTHDIKRSIKYISLAATVDLIVQEYEDGEIEYLFPAKFKGYRASIDSLSS